jgi:hypothetical protein
MRRFAPLMLLTAIGVASPAALASPAVKEAAQRFVGGIEWQEKSVLKGDFRCDGRQRHAILGTSDKEVVVAVFTQGLAHAPEVLRFDREQHTGEVRIRLDDAALNLKEIETLAGMIPPGYRPSPRCKGVRLVDDASDAAHIYWDHDKRRFDSWSPGAPE